MNVWQTFLPTPNVQAKISKFAQHLNDEWKRLGVFPKKNV